MNLRNLILLKITMYSNNQISIYLTSKRSDTIYILKKNLEKHWGLLLTNQILYYNGHPISDVMPIGNLIEASNSGTVINLDLDIAVIGGADKMKPIIAPDMTSEDCFESVTFSTTAPFFRVVSKGINFEGICRNSKCIARDDIVCVRLKMCEDSNNICVYNEYMFELKCPACRTLLSPDDIVNVDFMDCVVKVKYKIVEESSPQEYEMIATADEYVSLKECHNLLKYNYIKFTLK